MKPSTIPLLLAAALCSLLIATPPAHAAATAQWPQWRGPAASGVDASRALPVRWNVDTGENIRWRTPVPGLAHSSPIVWGDRIYVTTAIKPGEVELKVGLYGAGASADDNAPHQWRLLALDRATGKILWDTLAHEGLPRHQRHTKASQCNSTPATDGTNIVALFGSEGLFCFDRNGRLRWRKDLGKMDAGKLYSPPALQWGFASSPVLHDGLIFVQCDVVSEQFIAAYRVSDGSEVWRTPRSEVGTWCTPAIETGGGRRQVIVNGYKHIGGYDLDTGRERWRLRDGGDNPIPTPVLGHGLIYLTSAHGKHRPVRAIRPDAMGDITPADITETNGSVVWVHPRQGSYLQTPIVVGGLLYGCHDTGVLTCFDARTGSIHYSERLAGGTQGFSASPVSDGRHLYFSSELGDVHVIPAGTAFSKAAVNSVGEICMATPAITDGALIFRTRGHVLAVGAEK
jgi:outer membrane protein assembly factor BamB